MATLPQPNILTKSVNFAADHAVAIGASGLAWKTYMDYNKKKSVGRGQLFASVGLAALAIASEAGYKLPRLNTS